MAELGLPQACDLLVIGSGAAGMAAAIVGRLQGLDVVLVEKAKQVGGTTARSGGWVWIPDNHLARRAGIADSPDEAVRYLAAEGGEHWDPVRARAYVTHAAAALAYFERHSHVRFLLGTAYPDYHPDKPGGLAEGRSLYSEPFDGGLLGPDLALLASPLPESLFLGMGLNSGPELKHFLNATRSPRSALYVAGRLGRHVWEKLRHGRGTRLVNGNALAARLLKSARDAGVKIVVEAPAIDLMTTDGRVAGARIRQGSAMREVRARRGVVLASGGYSWDIARRAATFAHVRRGHAHVSLVPESNTGDGLGMAEDIGAAIDTRPDNPAAWAPVSKVPRPDGNMGIFFHLIDRAKPGVILVGQDGQRFCNETECYHDVVQAMVAHDAERADTWAFILCDHATLRRYGLGAVKPAPFPLAAHMRSGYLLAGRNLDELARRMHVPAAALSATVQRFNGEVDAGADTYARGASAYNRLLGDIRVEPNPCLGRIERGPFYAIRVHAGDLGTYQGLACDEYGRVRNASGQPIEGLYAAGNDAATFAGGSYPGAGAMLGPALTFGYLSALHAAGAMHQQQCGKEKIA